MSLRTNLVANFAGQFWGMFLGIAMVPLYVRFLGIESYALIGFNAILQSWLMLLDMGMSPTLGREVARNRAGSGKLQDLVGLLNSLEFIFIGLAIVVFALIWSLSDRIASDWLEGTTLPANTVSNCLVWMGAMTGFRWLTGLYRGGIVGSEKQVWLNGATAIIYTVRFVGVVPVIIIQPEIQYFFAFMAITTAAECGTLRWYLRRELKASTVPARRFSSRLLRTHARFTGSLAVTGAIWVAVTQSDKLILSKILPLENFGYFSIAVLLAGGITLLVVPLQKTFTPRLTVFAAQKDEPAVRSLYHLISQLIVVIYIS